LMPLMRCSTFSPRSSLPRSIRLQAMTQREKSQQQQHARQQAYVRRHSRQPLSCRTSTATNTVMSGIGVDDVNACTPCSCKTFVVTVCNCLTCLVCQAGRWLQQTAGCMALTHLTTAYRHKAPTSRTGSASPVAAMRPVCRKFHLFGVSGRQIAPTNSRMPGTPPRAMARRQPQG
jgi:hypothetical protein